MTSEPPNEHWYSVRMSIQAIVLNEPTDSVPIYEDRMILVRAQSAEEAATKGEAFGRASDGEYSNVMNDAVYWEFREVTEVLELLDEPLGEGSTVYWKFVDETELRRELDYEMPPGPESPLTGPDPRYGHAH